MHECAPTQTPEIDHGALRAKYLSERDKRLRPEGQKQYLVTEGEFAEFYESDPYLPVTPRAPITEDIDVAVLGGGEIVGPDLGVCAGRWRGDPHRAAAGRADIGDAGGKRRERIERLAEPGQGQRLDVILQVGRLAAGVRLDEGAELGRRHGHRSAPGERVLRRKARALH